MVQAHITPKPLTLPLLTLSPLPSQSALTAVVHTVPPAPEQDATGGAGMGIGPQCRTDVREGLLVVAGLVHTSLWEAGGRYQVSRAASAATISSHLLRCPLDPPCRRAGGSPHCGTSQTHYPFSAAWSSGSLHTPLETTSIAVGVLVPSQRA